MTKSKTIAAAIAALTVAASLTAFNGQAQAHHFHHGWGLGAGIVAGTLIGAAAASNAYYESPATPNATTFAAMTAGAIRTA